MLFGLNGKIVSRILIDIVIIICLNFSFFIFYVSLKLETWA